MRPLKTDKPVPRMRLTDGLRRSIKSVFVFGCLLSLIVVISSINGALSLELLSIVLLLAVFEFVLDFTNR